MVTIDFISLPKEVYVPAEWAETPDLEARVDRLAQSYFSDWQDASLNGLHTAFAFVGVSLAFGIGMSIYFVSLPSIILCSAGLIICLIGDDAVRREQISRCQNVCLELEDWCQQFKEAGEKLKEKIEPFVFVNDADDQEINPKDLKEILDVINGLPKDNLKDLGKKLEAYHHQLFGEKRNIDKGIWSSFWITRYFNTIFCSREPVDFLKKCIQNVEGNTNKAYLNGILKAILKELSNEDQIPYPNPRAKDQEYIMYLLADRFGPPQGQESFATMMEEAEYWRQNIAIFRSSLTRGPDRIRLLGNDNKK